MSYTTRSYIIYFGILIFSFIMATWADKWNNKRYIFWIALVLSFFMGYRGKNVGIDTINYYNMFKSLTSMSVANNYNDSGFYKVAYLFMRIKNDPYFAILAYSTLSNFIVIYRLWDFRSSSSFNFSVLRYVSLFYFYSFNCMRQFFSMTLVLYATKYLEEKKYYKFIIFVLIASYFHIAALTSIGYIALEKLRWKELSRKEKNIINIMYIFSPLAIMFVFNSTERRVDPYWNTTSALNNYLSYFAKIIIFMAFVFVTYNRIKEDTKEKDDKNYISKKMQLIYYFIGLVLNGLGLIWAQLERVGYYYYIFAPNYVGIITKDKKYKWLFITIVLIIVIRAYYRNCVLNSMGQMPYMFNWE